MLVIYSMQRLIFWGIIILILLLIGTIVDQIFYRTIRLFFEKSTAQTIRFWTFIVVIATIISNGFIGHYYTRITPSVKKISIPNKKLPDGFDGFTVAQISDFHINSFDPEKDKDFFDKLIEKIVAEKPDIICFTGDLVTTRSAEALPFTQVLSSIASLGIPVYSVMGNHDYADYTWRFDESQKNADRDSLRTLQKEAGWVMLDNSSFLLKKDNDSIIIVGVGNIGEPPFTTYGNLSEAMSNVGGISASDNTYTILLSHNPIHWKDEVIPSTSIDLTLSGHTHSMQFKIANWSPSKWKYKEWSGLYQEGAQFLYVNSGLGCVGPKIRIGVKPEITIITLTK